MLWPPQLCLHSAPSLLAWPLHRLESRLTSLSILQAVVPVTRALSFMTPHGRKMLLLLLLVALRRNAGKAPTVQWTSHLSRVEVAKELEM